MNVKFQKLFNWLMVIALLMTICSPITPTYAQPAQSPDGELPSPVPLLPLNLSGPVMQHDTLRVNVPVAFVPTGVIRYVATTGLDAGNDCLSRAAPCRTLQHAHAQANEGDMIKVAGGTYADIHAIPSPPGYQGPSVITQVVYITKTVHIRGGYSASFNEPPDPTTTPTILDAQHQGRGIIITGNINPVIENVHILHGNIYSIGCCQPDQTYGGGIYIWGSAAVISNTWIYSNTAAGGGGGVCVGNGNGVQIIASRIFSNSTPGIGGGMYVASSQQVTLSENLIYANTGGGIAVDGGSLPWQITRNTIQDNTGDGLWINFATVQVNENIIQRNSGNGIKLTYYASPQVTNNTISDNGENGILIDIGYETSTAIHTNTFSNNAHYAIYNATNQDIDATGNNFGVTTCAGIADLVYDYNDDHTRGLVAISTDGAVCEEHIDQSVTWSGPQVLTKTRHIFIHPGATLTIEAGVQIRFDGPYGIFNHGHLRALGNWSAPVVFTSTQDSVAWGILKFEHAQGTLDYVNIQHSQSGLQLLYSPPLTISHSLIAHNLQNGITTFGTAVNIIGNRIKENGGHGIEVGLTHSLIDGNWIESNGSDGIAFGYYGSAQVTNNIIRANGRDGISLAVGYDTRTSIHHNTFGSNGRYALYHNSRPDLDATDNDWGTSDCIAIAQAIYDFNDDPGLGLVAVNNGAVTCEQHITGVTTWSGVQTITRHIWIEPNATLIIQPGTQVLFDGYYGIFNHGFLQIAGSAGNWVNLASTQPAIRWATIKFDYADGVVQYAKIQQAHYGLWLRSSSPAINHAFIAHNYLGVLAESSNAHIADTTVTENQSHGMWIVLSSFTLNSTTISYNGGYGIGSDYYGNVDISTSRIINNALDGLSMGCGYGTISRMHYSSIYGNGTDAWRCQTMGGCYDIRNQTPSNIDARNNYWGTVDPQVIDQRILDYHDDSTWGCVYYQPFLGSDPTARMLSLYVLAFDNFFLSPMNLDAYFVETIQSIANATLDHPEKTAIVLADRGGANPDAVYEIRNGIVRIVSSQWPSMTTEIKSTDPALLGNFIRWARTNYPADKTTFTYIGHNMPIPPETDWSRPMLKHRAESAKGDKSPWGSPLERAWASQPDDLSSGGANLFPLPIHIGVDPDYTDYTSRDILSTYDLAEALRIGTNDGASPLDVANLSFCFGLSLENVYPLRNYATTIIGSPNYMYFSPELAGVALQATNPAQTAEDMAGAIVMAFDAALPAGDHPRIITAIRTAPLDAIKEAWDAVSYYLMQGLRDPLLIADYKASLRQAYLASGKYDTTFCEPQDWDCKTPDAVIDAVFADHLRLGFGDLSPVGIAAGDAWGLLNTMVITRAVQNGTPWFAAPLTPTWNFDGNLGIGLYADLEGKALPGGVTGLNGIAHWYTSTISADNPQPYAFIAGGAYSYTWADVFHAYWQGAAITTTMCLPTFPPILETGDVSALGFTFPLPGWVKVGANVTIAPTISTATTVHNVLVAITVTQNNVAVFTDTIAVGYLAAGAHQLEATRAWIPAAIGEYVITVKVDAANTISETDETNNIAIMTGLVRAASTVPQPVIAAETVNGQQWFYTRTIPLSVTQIAAQPLPPDQRVNRLTIDFWQYQSGANPNTQIPVRLGQQIINTTLPQTNLPVTLPPAAQPGIVIMHIWPRSNAGGLGYPEIVQFSYLLADTPINAGQEHYYTFDAAADNEVELMCSVSQGSANLFVWEPGNPWSAQTIACSGAMVIAPTLAGEYLVSVRGAVDNTLYTLTATRGNPPVPLFAQAAPLANLKPSVVARTRPTFIAPVPVEPKEQMLRKIYLPLILR